MNNSILPELLTPSVTDINHVQEADNGVFEFPASYAQRRLWFIDQLAPGIAAYNISSAFRLKGFLDVPALQRCLDELTRRHEALRTAFATADGQPVQVIAPNSRLELRLLNLRSRSLQDRELEAGRHVDAEVRKPFDLSRSPLARVLLVRIADDDHIFVMNLHHTIADGWSLGVLSLELESLYAAFTVGAKSPLTELPVQYADYTLWEQEWLQGDVLKAQLDYWREQLEGAPAVLDLPSDRRRPSRQSFRGSWLPVRIPEGLTTELKNLSRREGVTLFTTLLAGFNVLLHRYTGQTDLCIGTPNANRSRGEVEGVIGFFVNTVVNRTDVSGDPSFRDLVKRVHAMTAGSNANAAVPFEHLVAELRPSRDLSHNPLFQVLFTLQNPPLKLRLADIEATTLEVDNGTAKFDLFFELWEEDGEVRGRVEYSADLFDRSTAERIAGHYIRLLEGIVAQPDRRISCLPLITPAERIRMNEWNATASDYPADRCVHDLFEDQVLQTPGVNAVAFEGKSLTYRELSDRANVLARELQALGVGPDVPVGIFLDRSLAQAVAVLAVLKAGGAYLPLDPKYPKDRLAYMIEDSRAAVLLSVRKLASSLPKAKARLVTLDQLKLKSPGISPRATSSPDDLAYVIYTSGSTGRPKGVAMPHRPLVNLLSWQIRSWQMRNSAAGPRTKTLQFASLSFDVSFQEMFSTWLSGGTLVIAAEGVRGDFKRLLDFLADESISRLFLPFTALQQLAVAAAAAARLPDTLREIITAGEQLQITPEIESFFARLPGCEMENQYGPTECHVVTRNRLSGPADGWPTLPTIGGPISNVQITLLDSAMNQAPIGVPAELYIGGICLARGYLDRPELTAERFTPGAGGGRLYRTGDLARYLPDGSIEFLGRVDDQVKVRGFRIELGEIEATLRKHSGIRESAVAFSEGGGGKRLVAYVVTDGAKSVASAELRKFLRQRLPDYMVPSIYISLPELPLTPSGKVNRKRLPQPSDLHRPERETGLIEPRDSIELQLVQIWESALGVQPIGIADNFFELGGHSLLAARVFAQIEKVFGQTLPVAILFESPTVERLAEVLRKERGAAQWSSLVAIQSGGSNPPFFCIHEGRGDVLWCGGIARHLGPDQPFYALQPRGLSSVDLPFMRVEEMAAHYVDQIRRIQPQGPYYLGGWSFGGLVAFEMACQLEARGQQVGLLALLDAYAPGYTSAPADYSSVRDSLNSLAERFTRHAEALSTLEPKQKIGYLRTKSRGAVKRMARNTKRRIWKGVYAFHEAIGLPVPRFFLRDIRQVNRQAARVYAPKPFAGTVHLFRATNRLAGLPDPAEGWNELARSGLEIHDVPGDHGSMVREPHVRLFASELAASLSRARLLSELLHRC